MNELTIQKFWKSGKIHGYLNQTASGHELQILNAGQINHHAGPDFLNAKVKIGDQVWCGAIEIHVRASEWWDHRHDMDPAYNVVVLHVVVEDDAMVMQQNGNEPPTAVIPAAVLQQLSGADDAPDNWSPHSLLTERLNKKADELALISQYTMKDPEWTAWIWLSRGFGAPANQLSFERMLRSAPLTAFRRASFFSRLSLLLGLSGTDHPDASKNPDFIQEFNFWLHKHSIQSTIISFDRSSFRPSTSLYRRCVSLSHLPDKTLSFHQMMMNTDHPDNWKSLLEVPGVPGYPGKILPMNMLLNTALPYQWFIARQKKDRSLQQKVINTLNSLPAESNRIVRTAERSGIPINSAYESQAAIQWYRVSRTRAH